MPFFGKRRETPSRPAAAASRGYATAASLPEPSGDWTILENIRSEWENQLEGTDQGRLGWSNGTRMFQEGVIPGQKSNVAEYITRGLAYHLFTPILTDADALVASRRVLTLVDEIPAVDAFFARFGPKAARLALAVIREKGWQPASLGGDDSVTDEILGARPDGLVVYAARSRGVLAEDAWKHFFFSTR